MEENEIHVFQSNHLYCPCYYGQRLISEPNDEYLIPVCREHPLFSDFVMEGKYYTCYKFEICSYYVNVRYVLNFIMKNVCAREIPKYLENAKTFDEYLENNLKYECFFYFSKSVILTSIDNLKYDDMKNVNSVRN